MSKKTIQISFFVALTLCLLVVSFLIFKPYLGIIFLAAVLSTIFYPLYKKFLSWFGGHPGIAATSTLLVIVVIIVIPTVLVSGSIFKEAVGLYNSIAFGGMENIIAYTDTLSSKLGQTLFNDSSFRLDLGGYFQSVLTWVISHFDSFFTTVFKGLLGFVLMLISIYYLLCYGSRVKEHIKIWSPLPDRYDEEIFSALQSSTDAVFRGRFLVAIAQGLFLGLGFVIFGISNSVLWGFVGAVTSLIPALGTSIVTIPAIIYLFVNGNIGAGIGMIIWAAVAVGLVDDTLSFFILKRRIKVHPLIVLFSILGGVQLFGAIGFLAGPVLVSAFLSLLRIYPFVISSREE